MADTKISNLAAVTDVQDTDEFVLARAGVTNKIDGVDLAAELGAMLGEIAYAEITSPVTVSATTAASANDVVSSGAVSYVAARIKIEFFAPYITVAGSAGSFTVISLWDDTTDLGLINTVGHGNGTQAMQLGVYIAVYLTPSAGSHTYQIKSWRVTANGSIETGTNNITTDMPAYIRISRTP